MSFDLSSFRPTSDLCEVGYSFEPRLPGGESGIGATITVCGPQSAAVRAHNEARYDMARRREAMAKKRGKEVDSIGLAEIEGALIDLAVAHTTGWTGFVDGGQPVPFTPQAARDLYTKHPWLRDQVLAEGQELGNFLPKSSSSSSRTQLQTLP